jgi:hypothetical protein
LTFVLAPTVSVQVELSQLMSALWPVVSVHWVPFVQVALQESPQEPVQTF